MQTLCPVLLSQVPPPPRPSHHVADSADCNVSTDGGSMPQLPFDTRVVCYLQQGRSVIAWYGCHQAAILRCNFVVGDSVQIDAVGAHHAIACWRP